MNSSPHKYKHFKRFIDNDGSVDKHINDYIQPENSNELALKLAIAVIMKKKTFFHNFVADIA